MKRSRTAQRTGWVSFIGTAGSLFCQVVYPSRKSIVAKIISGDNVVSGKPEMKIERKGSFYTLLFHQYKADAIRKGNLLVCVLFKNIDSFNLRFTVGAHDLNNP